MREGAFSIRPHSIVSRSGSLSYGSGCNSTALTRLKMASVGANAERQRQDDDRGEPRRSPQLSTGVAKI